MARVELPNLLSVDAQSAPAADAQPAPTAQKAPRKAAEAPSERPATGKAGKSGNARKAPQGAPRKAAEASSEAEAVRAASAPREPVVLACETTSAKRISLLLHPDDADWLKYGLRGGDVSAVLRSLIAVARADDRLATQVARLSREAPRGGR